MLPSQVTFTVLPNKEILQDKASIGITNYCFIWLGMWLVIMELVPGFSLYRGIYELSEYATAGRNMGKPGMRWADLNDPVNGMKDVLILMSTEWLILLLVAFLLDHRPAWKPLFLFGFLSTKHSSPSEKPNKLKRGSRRVHVDMTKPDVFQEVSKAYQRYIQQRDIFLNLLL